MEISFSHRPVMLNEVIEGLDIKPRGVYVDGTTGGGGHSYEIASRLSGGRLICIDRDTEALAAAGERLKEFGERVCFVHSNYSELASVLGEVVIDGFLLDLGVSSYQLDNPERGFSYQYDAPLDMRMNREDSLSAYDVVNGYSEEKLKQIIRDYGEERFAGRIASRICARREVEPIKTTYELVDIIKGAIPAASREGGHHPAKRSFQAIRIEVNGELEIIADTIKTAADRMKNGGRIAIITFHSLEDRIVKQTFASLAIGCTCPPDFPVCVCGKKSRGKAVNRKPISASAQELEENPRGRSAKLRVFEVYPQED